MLTLYHNGNEYVFPQDDYYIREVASGIDEVIFNVNIYDEYYKYITEEEYIIDERGQRYLIKQIDAGATTAKVICQLDLDEWKNTMYLDYSNESATIQTTIEGVMPPGWTLNDYAYKTISRTITGSLTAFEICEQCRDIYSVYIRWNNKNRTVSVYPNTMGEPVGAFATKELNLREINYKGKSTNFATRLYPFGKDGLTIKGATIDGRVYPYDYVQNTEYADKIVCAYWKDERYTVVDNLYSDAVKKLEILAKPERSYSCSIVDLQATNPEKYNNLDFSLFTSAMLIDDAKGTSVNYQVVERKVFPHYPEKNEVIFDSVPQKITNTVTNIVEAIEDTNSEFQQTMQAAIQNGTDLITGNSGGYVVLHKNEDGKPIELLVMDTEDIETAQNVWRFNNSGLGYSNKGYNGPYKQAWTIDGAFYTDWVTAGRMTANIITAGTLKGFNGNVLFDLDAGTLTLKNKALRILAGNFQLDANGNVKMTGTVTATGGKIGSFNIGTGIYSGKTSLNSNANGVYIGTDGVSFGKHGNIPAFMVEAGGDVSVSYLYFRNQNGTRSKYGLWTSSEDPRITSGGAIKVNTEEQQENYLGGLTELTPKSSSSDRRIKKNVKNIAIGKALSVIAGLRPVSFEYKKDCGDDGVHHGFIAQEVEEVADWDVVKEVTGIKVLNYQELIPDIVRVLQYQQKEIMELKARLSMVEVENNG